MPHPCRPLAALVAAACLTLSAHAGMDDFVAGPADDVNKGFNTAARFLNMHAAAGVPAENMSVAIVVHGPAASDLLTAEKLGHANPSAPLIAELLAAGASIQLCGQTAAARDFAPEDLLPGITVSLSAMTSHALLQQDGYTLNPF